MRMDCKGNENRLQVPSSQPDPRPKGRFSNNRLLMSFSYALSGIFHVIRTERNMRIHLGVAVLVLISAAVLSLTVHEWLFVIFAICGVFILEMINSALERLVDLVTQEYHPLAKQVKDIAAGAVFIYAILSITVGCIIFLPKILALLMK